MTKTIVAAALLFASAARMVCPQTRPLDSLAAVHALSNAEASRHLPVEFEATVTYYRAIEKTLFVQDGDAAIFVMATTGLDLSLGDHILIRGVTEGSFRPLVVSSNIARLAHGSPPAPARPSFGAMLRSDFDCRYVVVHGTVRSANLTLSSGRRVTEMVLQSDTGMVTVSMDNPDPGPLKGLLGAEVEVIGALSGQFDGKMQATGLLLHSMSFREVKILRRAVTDPWSLPATPMGEVLQASEVQDRSRHVRVQGTLTWYRPKFMAVLQDGNRSIRVETPQIDRLTPGDSAEAIGIPTVEDNFLTLKLGTIRSTGKAPPIIPPVLTWDQVASGKVSFNLVSLDGTLVSQVREQTQDVYVVSDGKHLFTATFRHPFVYEWNVQRDPPPMPPIRSGSRVRATGVAILDDGNPYNGAMAFGILLRTAQDVAVVGRPSLINVQDLLLLAGVLIVVVLLVVARGWSLERRVRREMALTATAERWRSRILEDINRARPLREILGRIVDLLSYRLKGTPCWCRLAGGDLLGNAPSNLETTRLVILQHEIPSHTGAALGTMFAGIQRRSSLCTPGPEALFGAAQLAALAIETRGLYSDLVHRSEFDLLTDTRNRFSLVKQFDQLLDGEHRDGTAFGLIYIDLDDFKLVNDHYGHHTGDLYLQEAARRMNAQLRPGDTLSRMGGDEFAVLVPMVRCRADAAEIAARLEHCFGEPFRLEGAAISGTASVGVALYPEDGTDLESLLSTADAAMYVSKNTRRNKVGMPAD